MPTFANKEEAMALKTIVKKHFAPQGTYFAETNSDSR